MHNLIAALVLVSTTIYADSTDVFSIGSADVTSVTLSMTKPSSSILEVVLTADKAEELATFTHQNMNRKVAIYVAGELVSEPLVRAHITGGQTAFNLDDVETALRLTKALMIQ